MEDIQDASAADQIFDLLVIGGGINGCGIARDAAGRGLTVMLCEKDDLAQATSSSSTKLFHGGLRYLEHFEFRLVREALIERETLLTAMPHIAWPLRFVLPIDPQQPLSSGQSGVGKLLRFVAPLLRGKQPPLLIRSGLFIYDHLGGREILPGTKTLDLRTHKTGNALQPRFIKAYEYSDCWVEDSRLVVLNAKDAANRGALIKPRTICVSAQRENGVWRAQLRDTHTQKQSNVRVKGIINAGGPWVGEILKDRLTESSSKKIRLVRGSHIVTRKLFDHDQPYFFQLHDGRIIFAIPYEVDYTLIGTTDQDHDGSPDNATCSAEEQQYLLDAVNGYFNTEVTEEDIVWSYAGVRLLYDNSASSATTATRDYVLSVHDEQNKLPLLNVFGGKLTTYRRLAEEAMKKMGGYYPHMGAAWTAKVPLPGGDFAIDELAKLVDNIRERYQFVDELWAQSLMRRYGTEVFDVYADATKLADLGEDFGANLYEREVRWLIEREWAQTAEDILWRRTKLGLRLNAKQQKSLASWIANRTALPPTDLN